MDGATPELAKFHEVLAPKWHAPEGPKRMTDACAAIGDFSAAADAVAKAPPPAKANAAVWTQESKELVDAVAALKIACVESKDSGTFQKAFAQVHQEFHELLEALGGTKGEHEGHEEHEDNENKGY
jgi:hypothetical protein